MGPSEITLILVGACATLASGWTLWQLKRKQVMQDSLDARVRVIELDMARVVGEEQLRRIIADELAKWELCMMKSGRIGRGGKNES